MSQRPQRQLSFRRTLFITDMGGSCSIAQPERGTHGAGDERYGVGERRERSASGIKYSTMEEKYPAGRLSIYFGSQTGTAMGFAKALGLTLRKCGFEVRIIDLADFDPGQFLLSRVAIFIVATYGEGNPTDNALHFYEWLCNPGGKLPSNHLENVSYAVFGLGNSTYVHYNQMGKDCNEKLELLGGQRLFPLACGDDSCTLEEDFDAWKPKIAEFLAKKYLPKDESPPPVLVPTRPRAHLSFTTQVIPSSEPGILSASEISTTTKYFFSSSLATLANVRDLRSTSDPRRTLHLELDLSKTDINYTPADNLAIIPENSIKQVESFATCCGGYSLSQFVCLIPTLEDDDVEFSASHTFRHPFPNPCSVQTIFTKYLDINGIPRRTTLERFSPYVTNSKQLEWLDDITSKDNREKYVKTIEEEGRTYASLLANELSSCIIPLDDLLHLIPFIQPRFYTIASSNSVFPRSAHLTGNFPSVSSLISTVTILQRASPSGAKIHGFCTNYLASLSVGDACRVYVRESIFKLPQSIFTPIIMIGPGSGIAPMRALLQEREHQAKEQNIPCNQVTNILYFGCQSKELDFLYESELKAAVDRHALTSLKVAFSRETPKKVYVQHLMRETENAEEIYRLFKLGAHIFVCGGTEMGAAVAESFVEIISRHKSNFQSLSPLISSRNFPRRGPENHSGGSKK